MKHFTQKKCEVYWPDNADETFIPAPGSPLTIKYKSMLPFAEFVIRKMVATHVSVMHNILYTLFMLLHIFH